MSRPPLITSLELAELSPFEAAQQYAEQFVAICRIPAELDRLGVAIDPDAREVIDAEVWAYMRSLTDRLCDLQGLTIKR